MLKDMKHASMVIGASVVTTSVTLSTAPVMVAAVLVPVVAKWEDCLHLINSSLASFPSALGPRVRHNYDHPHTTSSSAT
jgi:hypothetical protein